MKKVIVTGANGFIGSALLHVLSCEKVKIFAIIKDINEPIVQIENLEGVSIIYCSQDEIEKLPELIPDRDIDCCIHLAWAGSFGSQRSDYELQLLNVNYAMNTVDAIAAMNVKRFIGAGTLAEKDVLNYHLLDGATPNDVSIYGIAKIATHLMTKTECTKLGVEHVWCYFSNTYGVGNTTDNFINMACKKMLNNKRAVFTAGEQMYDFVYITDMARAIFAASEKGKTNSSYYLGSTNPKKLKDYIIIIRDMINPEIELFLGEIPFNGASLPDEEFDTNNFVRDTGYQPEINFQEGIKMTIDWLKEQQNAGKL